MTPARQATQWTWGPTEDPGIAPDFRHIRLEVHDGDGNIVARLPDGSPAGHAALIASAPSLLAAAQTLLASLAWEEGRSGTTYHGMEDLQAAVKAAT